MIDITSLEQQLLAPAARQIGDDDPAINEMLRLAEHNDFLAAAAQAQKLWDDNVYDVRTLGCFLVGVFMERGLPSLPRIFDCLLRALTLNWEYLGPVERKQRLCDVSLRWLFTTLRSQIDFHQRAKSSQWERWNEGWTLAGYREAADRCVQLGLLIEDVLPDARCRGRLLNFQATLDGIVRPSSETAGWKVKMQNATHVPAPPEVAESSQGAGAPSPSSADGSSGDSPPEPAGDSADSQPGDSPPSATDSTPIGYSSEREFPPPVPTGESLSLPLSPALRALLRQLDSFLQLVHSEKFGKAAILHRQIQQSIEHFAPLVFLPSLFGPYYAHLARHGPRLSAALKESPNFATAALVELSRLDLDLFLETEIEE